MGATTIERGEAYYMLRLTMSWTWDYKNRKHIQLPRLWKVSNVLIGEQVALTRPVSFRREVTILIYKILYKQGRDTWERVSIDSPIGDYEETEERTRWGYEFNNNKKFFFFHTKNEALQKLLSIRNTIELYNAKQVEQYRDATMKKIKKMNDAILKLDKVASNIKKEKKQ